MFSFLSHRRISILLLNYVHNVAIIGTGPSGFYTAKYLLERRDDISVDLIEKLPVPFGLVRFGVAPDHPEVKNVIEDFSKLFGKYSTRIRYFGNVQVWDGSFNTISVAKLRMSYTAVVLAYGAASDANLGIKGEQLEGVLSARNFVNWYNGHPDFSACSYLFNLQNVKNVVIIGQGNVALDCARILATDPSTLAETDISREALKSLSESNVESISIVGRRGHIQSSFTIKEFRELVRSPHINLIIDEKEVEMGKTTSSAAEIKDNKAKNRLVELIESSVRSDNTLNMNEKVDVKLRYLLSPVEVVADATNRVMELVVQRNILTGEPNKQRAVPLLKQSESESGDDDVNRGNSGSIEHLPCQLVLTAIRYKSLPMHGVPFDTKSDTIPSLQGRVKIPSELSESSEEYRSLRGVYVAGWLKRGPSGIIGTNINDAKETVASILEDLNEGVIDVISSINNNNNKRKKINDPMEVLEELRRNDTISWEEYLRIDKEEKKRALEIISTFDNQTKPPRIKILTKDEMLNIAKSPVK